MEARPDHRHRIICYAFHGSDQDRLQCPYHHDPTICRYWIRDTCARGQACKFKHEIPAGYYRPSRPPVRANQDPPAPAPAAPAEQLPSYNNSSPDWVRHPITDFHDAYDRYRVAVHSDRNRTRSPPSLSRRARDAIAAMNAILLQQVDPNPSASDLMKLYGHIAALVEGMIETLLTDTGLGDDIVGPLIRTPEQQITFLAKFQQSHPVGLSPVMFTRLKTLQAFLDTRNPDRARIPMPPDMAAIRATDPPSRDQFELLVRMVMRMLLDSPSETSFSSAQESVRRESRNYRYRLCNNSERDSEAHRQNCTFIHTIDDVFEPLLNQPPAPHRQFGHPGHAYVPHRFQPRGPATGPAPAAPAPAPQLRKARVKYQFTPDTSTGTTHGQIPLTAGAEVSIVYPDNAGWTYVRLQLTQEAGFCPTNYLEFL